MAGHSSAVQMDLLRRNLGEDQTAWPVRKTPAAKDIEELLEKERSPFEVKLAQKAVGELVYVCSRTFGEGHHSDAEKCCAHVEASLDVLSWHHSSWSGFSKPLQENSLNRPLKCETRTLRYTFRKKLFHREASRHRYVFTHRIFTQRNFYTQKFKHIESAYTREAFKQRSFYTQKPLQATC